MMATKVSELMPRTLELYTLTRTIILPVPRHPFDDEDDGTAVGDAGGSGDAGAIAAA